MSTDTKWYQVMPGFDQGSPKLGVLRLKGWGEDYLSLPGDIDDERSWAYPIIHEVVEKVTFELLCNPTEFKKSTETVLEGVTVAVQKLIKRGANALIANCGLFMWLHAVGIIEAAVDKAMDQLNLQNPDHKYRRPTVMLSSLNMLPAYLPTLGLGEQQRGVGPKPSEANFDCRVVVFTSNGDSCMELLKSVPQLKGCKLTRPSTPHIKGEVLVVGLNANDVLDGGPLRGFEAVAEGTPLVYSVVQRGVEKVAKALKEAYPSIALAIVECTQVSSFSDTIRCAMDVDVIDPINLGTSALELSVDHKFVQDDPASRLMQVKDKAEQAKQLKLSLGRCEKLDKVVEVYKAEVKEYNSEMQKKLLSTQPEEGQLDDLEKLKDINAKEIAALMETNKKQWDDIVAEIPNLPEEAQRSEERNLEKIAKQHQKNFAEMRAQHAMNFAKMKEMRQNNEVRKEQIALLRKRQAQP